MNRRIPHLYFKGKNFGGENVSRSSRILDKFAKVRESLSHAKWTSKTNLMKIETDLLEYV